MRFWRIFHEHDPWIVPLGLGEVGSPPGGDPRRRYYGAQWEPTRARMRIATVGHDGRSQPQRYGMWVDQLVDVEAVQHILGQQAQPRIGDQQLIE